MCLDSALKSDMVVIDGEKNWETDVLHQRPILLKHVIMIWLIIMAFKDVRQFDAFVALNQIPQGH